MTNVLAGALGFLVGLAAHDLGTQGLDDRRPLRPLAGSCPGCDGDRGWARGRCPRCGRGLRWEPVIALASAAAGVGFVNTIGITWSLVAFAGFLLLTAALVVSDLHEFRIVDRLNLRGSVILAVVLAAGALAEGRPDALLRGGMGALAYFAGASLLWFLVRGRGFGAGDVKLSPVLGLFTAYISWGTLGWSVFATAIIGGVLAIAALVAGGAKMDTELPYGPPMVLGAWLAVALVGTGFIPIAS